MDYKYIRITAMNRGKFLQNCLYVLACVLHAHYLVLVIAWEQRQKNFFKVLLDDPSIKNKKSTKKYITVKNITGAEPLQ